MKNNTCIPDTLEKQLADKIEYIKWNSKEIENKSKHIKWLYTVIIFLSGAVLYLLGIITPLHELTVICENTSGLNMPLFIPTWGIEKAPIY